MHIDCVLAAIKRIRRVQFGQRCDIQPACWAWGGWRWCKYPAFRCHIQSKVAALPQLHCHRLLTCFGRLLQSSGVFAWFERILRSNRAKVLNYFQRWQPLIAMCCYFDDYQSSGVAYSRWFDQWDVCIWMVICWLMGRVTQWGGLNHPDVEMLTKYLHFSSLRTSSTFLKVSSASISGSSHSISQRHSCQITPPPPLG